jgi:AraC-like DNA-binding protein
LPSIVWPTIHKKTSAYEKEVLTFLPIMHIVISISVISFCLVISLTCGIVILLKRREVPDRSRIYLAVFNLFTALLCAFRLFTFIANPALKPYHEVLAPFLLTGGLTAMVLYLAYPIEVINPGWLKWRRALLLALPALIALALPLCGVHYQHIDNISDIWTHLSDFDVLVRLAMIVCTLAYTFLLWFIPQNWRESSADKRWILRANLIIMVMGLLFFVQVFTTWPWSFHIHVTWVCVSFAYFAFFELFERLSPTAHQLSTPPHTGGGREGVPLWQQICQVIDDWEAWRNPNTSVETISAAVGTNRIYVARCVKEHTGLTVNDYINQKRVDYMAAELSKTANPVHKEIYFAAGYRSRQTAYRNFLKFKGVSPTEFVTAPESQA